MAGPAALTVTGAVLLLGALAVAVAVTVGFVGLLRTDVLGPDGLPGDGALAWAYAPGETTVELVAGERYAVHLGTPVVSGSDQYLEADVMLMTPSRDVIVADDPPGVNLSTVGAGGWSAVTVGAFEAPETGTYLVAVPPADVDAAWVALTPDRDVAPFVTGVVRTVLGTFVVVGAGTAGVGALAGGIAWWLARRRAPVVSR